MSPAVGPRTRAWSLIVCSLLAACGPGEAQLFEDDGDGDGVGEDLLALAQVGQSCTNPTSPLYALGGTLLTPAKALEGYLVVQSGKILDVVPRGQPLPEGAVVVETKGVITAGLFDLHNHVAYNFLPPWQPPRLYANRYEWAKAPEYGVAVRTPYNKLRAAGHLCEGQKYGELRALVGGTTAIQGSLGTTCQNGWARNVEAYNFCEDHVRQNVLAVGELAQSEATKLISQFDSGATRAYLVHAGEGVDELSRGELGTLEGLGLLRKELVPIHGTAFGAAELAKLGAAGMGVVWSPKSNLVLYGKTLDVPAALAAGVRIALAPDWSPSGSSNLLEELKVADQLNKTQFGGALSNVALVRMATQVPAELAGLGDKLGKLAPGYAADFTVFRRRIASQSAYRAVIEAKPQDVLLTAVDGVAWYGTPELLTTFGRADQFEPVNACGEARGLVVKNPAVANGNASLAEVLERFAADGVTQVAPLFNCP